jgi:hypothetical protein
MSVETTQSQHEEALETVGVEAEKAAPELEWMSPHFLSGAVPLPIEVHARLALGDRPTHPLH